MNPLEVEVNQRVVEPRSRIEPVEVGGCDLDHPGVAHAIFRVLDLLKRV